METVAGDTPLSSATSRRVTAVLLTFRRVKNFSVIDTDDGASSTNIFITGGARRLGVRAARCGQRGLLMQRGTIYVCCARDLLLAVYFLLLSKHSAAASLRSTCGSERGPPECRTQRSPTPAPHVGQATEANCLGVSS